MPRSLSLLAATAILAGAAPDAFAQEARTWTDQSGRTLEGSFVRQDASRVAVRRGDGREVMIEKAKLSASDLDYLKTRPATASLASTGARPAFTQIKLDPNTWKKGAPQGLGAVDFPQTIETPHFLIAGTAKIKPDYLTIYADACERVFLDVANDLAGLEASFGGKRMALWLVESDADMDGVARWWSKHASEAGWFELAMSAQSRWATSSIAGAHFTREHADSKGWVSVSRIFRTDKSGAAQRNAAWPKRLHFIAGDLFDHYSDPIRKNGDYTLSLIEFGFSFYREARIAGRIDTEVSFGTSSESVEGFRNGRAWPSAVKNLLRNPAARPSLDEFLKTPAPKAQPMDVGCAFGLMHFIHQHPERLSAFNQLIESARQAEKCPDPAAFAKAFGFDSPAGFDAAWIAFMQGDQFK